MAVLRPRTRLVYFRVSEEEFQQLNSLCATQGARSISDAARLAITKSLSTVDTDGSAPREDLLMDRLDRLTEKLETLEAKLSVYQEKAEANGK
jgi:hypothetical protein